MNRSFISVILGGFGNTSEDQKTGNANKNAKSGSAEDAAFIMQNSQNVVIVPGYGMAVAQAQHILREMSDELKNSGITVMDGPFFSVMPFPAKGLHSFSHVRYTPHYEWQDTEKEHYLNAHKHFNEISKKTEDRIT